MYWRPDCVRVLVAAGADVNVTHSRFGETALALAARQGDEEILQLLLDAGADVNAKDGDALRMAITSQNFNCAKKLLASGALLSPRPCLVKTQEVHDLLRAAGQEIKWLTHAQERPEQPEVKDLSLQGLCRDAVRRRLVAVNGGRNLFQTTPQLPVPTVVQEYLVHHVSLEPQQTRQNKGNWQRQGRAMFCDKGVFSPE